MKYVEVVGNSSKLERRNCKIIQYSRQLLRTLYCANHWWSKIDRRIEVAWFAGMKNILNYLALFIYSVPLEACSSSPCQKGGSCINVNVDTYVCMCRDGFFGITCD